MRNIGSYIIPKTFPMSLAASASAWVDVRLTDIEDIKVFLGQTWTQGTGSVTGVSVNLYPGMGGKDPLENGYDPIPKVISNPSSSPKSTVPKFADNYVPVNQANGYAAISQPSINQPSSALPTTNTSWYLNTVLNTWPQWVRFEIINLDTTKPVNIHLHADI